jgi:eukaryotic-like serine/threonine-protein kinase
MLNPPMMPAGTRMGVYELIAPLGSGGMGEVYRARDPRLGREVALKVLPSDLAANPSSLARFQQEARHVAALNHPNIIALFDLGTEQGVAYIVTELVDGATLRGVKLPLRKVTDIGAQIADALAAAHSAGVTHRDIKPDNVMVTREGRVKVLDFGVAKVTGPPVQDAVTIAHTAIGSAVGTVGYMAPEQVRGDDVDPRADIFAVGALLYELLAGEPAFKGETAAEIMTATLRADPPELRADLPDGIQRIVRRCLEKDPEERFQSARDLAFALRQLAGSSPTASAPVPGEPGTVRWRAWMTVAGVALGVFVTGAGLLRWNALRDAAIDPIQLTRLTADRRNESWPVLSPDGRSLAYVRIGTPIELLVRPVDSPDTITVVRSNTAISSPVWSSDGNQVCYIAELVFWCVGAAGGSPRPILRNASMARIAPDGTDVFFIRVFENQPWLFRRGTASDGERVGDAPLPMDVSVVSPLSPDGSSLIVAGDSRRWLVSLPAGTRRELASEQAVRTHAITWLPDSRHVVSAEETTSPIGSRLVVQDTRGTARRLIVHTADQIEAVTASPDGRRLVYSGGPVERDILEYAGDGTYVRTVAATSMLEGFPAWAPAGDRFVYRVGGPGQSDSLWLATVDGAPATMVQRLTSNAASQTPISRDGRVAYADRTGIQVTSVSGGRTIRVLTSANVSAGLCWSPDGEWIWYSEGPTRLARVPGDGGAPITVVASPGILLDCSQDGRWLVRRTPEGFVLTATDGTSERVVASITAYATHAANSAQFSEQGKRLYLLRLDRRTIDVLDVDSGRPLRTIAFGIPVEERIQGFSVSPDGTRVLLTTGGDRNDLWLAEGFTRPASPWIRWFAHWAPPARPGTVP